YFPALPDIAQDLGVSIAKVNLTITSYLVLQGLSPMIFGPMADTRGRRLVYIICLVICTGACIGMALLPKNGSTYGLLIFLRCLQSAGSASTISIGYGTITDITTPAERGLLTGIMTIGPYAGPAIGPIIGGILAGAFGWRGIFWFMAAFSGALAVTITLFLPETLRVIVQAGDVRPPAHLRPIIPVLAKYGPKTAKDSAAAPRVKPKSRRPVFLTWPDTLLMLVCNACSSALFQALMSSISTVFDESYGYLTQTTIGLCFLPVGVATCFSSPLLGRLIDHEYRRAGGSRGEKVSLDFDLEKARLRLVPLCVVGAALTTVGYGWTVGRTSIAAPLVFTFFYGFMGLGTNNFIQQILMDLVPGQGASVTAANNLFRCLLAAAVVSFQDPLRKAIGNGWLFTLIAGLVAGIIIPIVFVERRMGGRWRRRRAERSQLRADANVQKEMEGAPQDTEVQGTEASHETGSSERREHAVKA
ncbi:MFS general substrate transporter, partial [Auriculariales sp. MPI-PUGE-AT-0066]